MRTKLDIAEDVLLAAKALGKMQHKTAGQVISELARSALQRPTENVATSPSTGFLGFEPLSARDVVVTTELIERLREDEFL